MDNDLQDIIECAIYGRSESLRQLLLQEKYIEILNSCDNQVSLFAPTKYGIFKTPNSCI